MSKPTITTNSSALISSNNITIGPITSIGNTSISLTYAQLLEKVHHKTKTLEAIRNLAVNKNIVIDSRREAELIVYMTNTTYITLFASNAMPAFIEFGMI